MTEEELVQAVLDQWHLSCAFSQTYAMNREPSRARHLRLRALMHYLEFDEESTEK